MSKHVISVCIFCFICATHSPCASHVAVGTEQHKQYHGFLKDPNGQLLMEANIRGKSKDDTDETSESAFRTDQTHRLVKRDINDADYLKRIFAMYGDGEHIGVEGFEKLMKHLLRIISVKSNKSEEVVGTTYSNNSKQMCINHDDVMASLINDTQPTTELTQDYTIQTTCLATLYGIVAGDCTPQDPTLTNSNNHNHDEDFEVAEITSVWLYSNLAVLVISLCGVLGLAVIPIMQKRYYQQLLQFLVALAVGTLAGDALLHLLPHAMSPSHEEHFQGSRGDHDECMWKGFTAMVGLMFFFVMERVILFVSRWRKIRQLRQMENSRVKIIKENGADTHRGGEKQCMNKYSSFPLCYNDIITTPNNGFYGDGEIDNTATTITEDLESNFDALSCRKLHTSSGNKAETNQNITEYPSEIVSSSVCTEVNKMLSQHNDKENNPDYTVILREHENRHHGHSHAHGHVHAAPKSMSSVAWMVIMGDGLHNFTDGMAIGAAFSGSIAGGFSTAVAVFCHELPHELGDFAMLLKAGMTMKQALFYNLLSSVLCVVGNVVGVVLGNTPYASSWVFALAAGMFIYIALVDMIPELSSTHEDEGNLLQFCLHLSGLMLGVLIMTVIALYEHDLKHIFREP